MFTAVHIIIISACGISMLLNGINCRKVYRESEAAGWPGKWWERGMYRVMLWGGAGCLALAGIAVAWPWFTHP